MAMNPDFNNEFALALTKCKARKAEPRELCDIIKKIINADTESLIKKDKIDVKTLSEIFYLLKENNNVLPQDMKKEILSLLLGKTTKKSDGRPTFTDLVTILITPENQNTFKIARDLIQPAMQLLGVEETMKWLDNHTLNPVLVVGSFLEIYNVHSIREGSLYGNQGIQEREESIWGGIEGVNKLVQLFYTKTYQDFFRQDYFHESYASKLDLLRQYCKRRLKEIEENKKAEEARIVREREAAEHKLAQEAEEARRFAEAEAKRAFDEANPDCVKLILKFQMEHHAHLRVHGIASLNPDSCGLLSTLFEKFISGGILDDKNEDHVKCYQFLVDVLRTSIFPLETKKKLLIPFFKMQNKLWVSRALENGEFWFKELLNLTLSVLNPEIALPLITQIVPVDSFLILLRNTKDEDVSLWGSEMLNQLCDHYLLPKENKKNIEDYLSGQRDHYLWISPLVLRKFIAYGFALDSTSAVKMGLREFGLSEACTAADLPVQVQPAYRALAESRLWAAIKSQCSTEMIVRIIQQGEVPINQKELESGRTPLMFAVSTLDEAIVNALLTFDTLDVLKMDARDKNVLAYLPKDRDRLTANQAAALNNIRTLVGKHFKYSPQEIKEAEDEMGAVKLKAKSSADASNVLGQELRSASAAILFRLLKDPTKSLSDFIINCGASLDPDDNNYARLLSAHLSTANTHQSSAASFSYAGSPTVSSSTSSLSGSTANGRSAGRTADSMNTDDSNAFSSFSDELPPPRPPVTEQLLPAGAPSYSGMPSDEIPQDVLVASFEGTVSQLSRPPATEVVHIDIPAPGDVNSSPSPSASTASSSATAGAAPSALPLLPSRQAELDRRSAVLQQNLEKEKKKIMPII